MTLSRLLRPVRLALSLTICTLLLGACATGGRAVRDGSGFTPPVSEEIARLQEQVNTKPIGERIAFWGERFMGAPYDIDPLGEYVRTRKAVCDERVDCMYLVFRAVELAQANTPEGATDRALDLRFRTRGRIRCGHIVNYDERFEYAEDMVASGRWGRDITAELGNAVDVPGSRGRDSVTILPKDELLKTESYGRLRTGDLIFFVKAPEKRVVGEVVGHLGIIKAEDSGPKLIHASGSKASADRPGGGIVKEVGLLDYVSAMKFVGAMFTRFE